MTKREAKAKKLTDMMDEFGTTGVRLGLPPNAFAEYLDSLFIEMAAWQADECALASGGLKGDQQMIAIRNAGMEEA